MSLQTGQSMDSQKIISKVLPCRMGQCRSLPVTLHLVAVELIQDFIHSEEGNKTAERYGYAGQNAPDLGSRRGDCLEVPGCIGVMAEHLANSKRKQSNE